MYRSYPIAAHDPRKRFAFFQDIADALFCPIQLEAQRAVRESFSAKLETADLGSVKLVRVCTSTLSVHRRQQDIARLTDPPYLVKFQLKGESLWRQRGREVHIRTGDFVISSTAEPYFLHFEGEHDMPVLVVPRSVMRGLAPDPDQFLGMRLAREDADCGLLSSFVAQVVTRMDGLSREMLQRVETNILDLFGGILSARAPRGTPTRAQQLAQIRAYIASHLSDRRLGPAMIAKAFGVSTRYVHALFESEQATVGRYIRSLRVAACRKMLESDGAERASLTDVALSWGFYDLSHMTRCFRDECGVPPRRYLLQMRARRDSPVSVAAHAAGQD